MSRPDPWLLCDPYCAQFKCYHEEETEMNENEDMSVTEAELARVLELDAKATQGPINVWTHETNGEVSYRLRAPAHRNMAWVAQYDDALALAEYRTLTPRLARELAAARAAIKVAREDIRFAPHGRACGVYGDGTPERPMGKIRDCDCWKAATLRHLYEH